MIALVRLSLKGQCNNGTKAREEQETECVRFASTDILSTDYGCWVTSEEALACGHCWCDGYAGVVYYYYYSDNWIEIELCPPFWLQKLTTITTTTKPTATKCRHNDFFTQFNIVSWRLNALVRSSCVGVPYLTVDKSFLLSSINGVTQSYMNLSGST